MSIPFTAGCLPWKKCVKLAIPFLWILVVVGLIASITRMNEQTVKQLAKHDTTQASRDVTVERQSGPTDIVIAHCKSSIEWLNNIVCSEQPLLRTIHVYSKCNSTVPERLPSCTKVHYIENRGREAEVYYTHIIRNYKNGTLADYTLFMQDGEDEIHKRIPVDKLVPFATGHDYVGLSGVVRVAWKALIKENGTYSQPFFSKYFPDFFKKHAEENDYTWITTWRADFSVSKERVLANPYQMYVDGLETHIYEQYDFTEVFWSIMFNCTFETPFLIQVTSEITKKGDGHLIC